MPPQGRKPAAKKAAQVPLRDIGSHLPPEPTVNLEEAAPQGAEVRRTGPRRPEVLPPGRRNQPSPVPAAHAGAFTPLSTDADETVEEVTAEEVRARAAARLAERFGPVGDEPLPDERMATPLLDRSGVGQYWNYAKSDWRETGAASNTAVFEALVTATMFGLRCRATGAGEDEWQEWETIALDALRQLHPADPLDALPPAARFLWGPTGLLRDPGEDVLSLGQADDTPVE